ncbi:hypothetical protein EBR57_09670, partial [bacterium]|nr:hypothetical protein [bacterium]
MHHVDLNTSTLAKRATEQKYVRHILSEMYGTSSVDICHEFIDYPTATQAYCYLLDFIREHNPNLVKNIGIPHFQHTERVLLANHTLRQLNIPELEMLLNQCSTAMGKRVFHEQLTHPTTDIQWLHREYEWTQALLDTTAPIVEDTRQHLKEMRDVEKMSRLLVLRKLNPMAMVQLQKTLSLTQVVLSQDLVRMDRRPFSPKEEYFDMDLVNLSCKIDLMLQYVRQTFRLENLQNHGSTGDASLYLCPKVSSTLDEKAAEYDQNHCKFNDFHKYLNELMQQQKIGDTTEYVRIHETEKSGWSFQITKKRAALLRPKLTGTEWIIKSATGSNDEVTCPSLVQITSDMLQQKEVLQRLQNEAYIDVLAVMEQRFYDTLIQVAHFLGQVDVLMCKAHIARQFKYCRPHIAKRDKSFVQAEKLRHPLIERLPHSTTTYVANDIHLGCESQDGILLYGTNAV